ncbi:MAG: hypothetical protein AB1489_12355, partial [Acidobacteriota bacterium]
MTLLITPTPFDFGKEPLQKSNFTTASDKDVEPSGDYFTALLAASLFLPAPTPQVIEKDIANTTENNADIAVEQSRESNLPATTAFLMEKTVGTTDPLSSQQLPLPISVEADVKTTLQTDIDIFPKPESTITYERETVSNQPTPLSSNTRALGETEDLRQVVVIDQPEVVTPTMPMRATEPTALLIQPKPHAYVSLSTITLATPRSTPSPSLFALPLPVEKTAHIPTQAPRIEDKQQTPDLGVEEESLINGSHSSNETPHPVVSSFHKIVRAAIADLRGSSEIKEMSQTNFSTADTVNKRSFTEAQPSEESNKTNATVTN